jgi:pimeloyl-ACP methyl ester carboxylesterase
MLHTLGSLQPCHKPLCFYLALEAGTSVASFILRRCGFVLRSVVLGEHAPLQYWQRAGIDDGTVPLVVLHGVTGITAYVPLLCRLASSVGWGGDLLVPIFPTAAMNALPSLEQPPQPMPHVVECIREMVHRHAGSTPRAAFLGHSLGTGVLAALSKRCPELVAAAAFVDPICFLIYRRDLLHSFLYSTPRPLDLVRSQLHGRVDLPGRARALVGDGFRLVLQLIIRREPTIQAAFRRHFWWSQHWLDASDVRRHNTIVCLSGLDAIVPAREVAAHLAAASRDVGDAAARAELEVEMHDHWHHGSFWLHLAAQDRIVAALRRMASPHIAGDRSGLGAY